MAAPRQTRRAALHAVGAGLAAGWLARPLRAQAPLKAVRISSIGYVENGVLHAGGNQSSVVIAQGKLAARLAARGIGLEWVPVPSALGGPGFNEGLANRTVDFAGFGDFPALIGKAGGINTKLVVPAGRGTNNYLVVRAASDAGDIRDLKGKVIALHRGRPAELAFSQLVKSAGLTYADFKIYNINATAGAAALAAGKVDGLFTASEAFLLEDKKVGRIIWSTKGTNWKWRSELFVRTEFAEQHPDITQLVVTSYVEGAYWCAQEENREAAIKIGARTGTPLSVIARDYDESLPWKDRWSPLFDPYMLEHYRAAVAFALENGLIRKSIDLAEWFEPRYVQAALKELGLDGYWSERPEGLDGAPP